MLPSLFEGARESQQVWQPSRNRSSSPRDFDTLEQLIHLLLAQLLTQARQDVFQLALPDVAVAFFVEYLEASNELVCSLTDGSDARNGQQQRLERAHRPCQLARIRLVVQEC